MIHNVLNNHLAVIVVKPKAFAIKCSQVPDLVILFLLLIVVFPVSRSYCSSFVASSDIALQTASEIVAFQYKYIKAFGFMKNVRPFC